MEEEYDVVGMCTECHSDQPDSYMIKSAFDEPPCKYCGGKVTVVPKNPKQRARAIAQIDRQRGLFHMDAPTKEQ